MTLEAVLLGWAGITAVYFLVMRKAFLREAAACGVSARSLDGRLMATLPALLWPVEIVKLFGKLIGFFGGKISPRSPLESMVVVEEEDKLTPEAAVLPRREANGEILVTAK